MKTWIIILSICLAIVSNVKASHSLGSDMSYRCVGPNEYEITLNVYRDCNGSNLGNTATVNWSASCGAGAITVTRLAGYPLDITPVCATQGSSCSGGSSPIGVEQHTYRANVILPVDCYEVIFSWSLCCRNNAITTLNNPGTQSMYIESMVNNSIVPCNNSPVFLNPPVGFACDGFPVFFSDGGFDPDGDSLFFSLTDCQVGASSPVLYNAGFLGPNPLTSVAPITIDSSTGAIEFTPIGPQNFVMCVLVEEYRNGVKIGSVIRDIQFSVLSCSNAPPIASGVNGTASYEITACAESFFCFEINATDANPGDGITLTSNNGFVGSSFQTIVDTLTGAITGQFCWKPTNNDVGSNPFTVTVQDDACPIKSTNTYTYFVNVIENVNVGVSLGQDVQICAQESTLLQANTSAPNVQTVWWTPTNGLSNPNSLTTQAAPTVTTTYTIHIQHPDGCINTDSVVVNVRPGPSPPSIPDSIISCEGEDVILSTATNANAYLWTNTHGFSSTAQDAIIYTVGLLDSGYYTLSVIDTNGCQSSDTSLLLIVNATPNTPAISPNDAICQGDNLILNTTNIATSYIWTAPNGADTITSVNTISIAATSSLYQVGNWNLVVVDTNSCFSATSVSSMVVINNRVTATAFNNGPVCSGGAVQLSTNPVNNALYEWYSDAALSNLISTQQNPIITNITTDSTFFLVVITNGCASGAVATTVTLNPILATPNVPADFVICEGETIVLTTTTSAASYDWNGPNGFTSNAQNPVVIVNAGLSNAGIYTLSILDANACRSADTSVFVGVNANPASATITSNDPICFGDTLSLVSSSNCGQSQWIGPNGSSTSTLGTPGGGNVLWTIGSATNISSTDANYLSGDWYMICIDTITGCQSESNTITVDINPIPSTPAAFNNGPVCIGGTVQLTTTTVSNGSYAWYADSTLTTLIATSQNPIITNISTDSTFYIVTTVNGCTSAAGFTTVQVHPIPTTPDVPANITACEGDALVLTTTANASTYVWSGPNGFNSNQQSPTVINTVSVVDSGTYTLYLIDANGCRSADTTVQVIVHPRPTTPFIVSNNTPICEGNDLILSANTGVLGTTYEWFNAFNVSVGTGQTLTIVGATGTNAGDYYLITTVNTCPSTASNITTAIVDSIPNAAAFAGNDISLCNTFTTNLDATPPSTAIGLWTTASGATIANPNVANTAIYNLPIGTSTFYWTLTNGACADFSIDSMVVEVSIVGTDIADAGLDQNLCGQTVATLIAATPTLGTGQWIQSASQIGQGVLLTNPTNPNTTVTGLQQGNSYTFIWTLSNGSCTNYSADAVQINIDVAPPDNAYAGINILLCNQNIANLDAFVSQYGTGFWTSSSSATLIDPTLGNTTVINLPQDTSVFVWTLSNGTCLNYSTDSVLVVVSSTTDLAFAGYDEVLCVVDSITLSGGIPTTSTGIWTQSAGQSSQGIIITSPTDPNSTVTGIQTGQVYTFTWTLSTFGCANVSTDEVQYTINALPTEVAYAGPDIVLCRGNTVIMDAINPIFSTGFWSSNSSAIIVNPTLNNSNIVTIPTDTVAFYWALSNGSCLDYSVDTMLIIVTPTFSVDTANAGMDINLCNEDTAQLMAIAPNVAIGRWTQPLNQSSAGVVLTDPNAALTTATGLQLDSTYTFTWLVSNGPCQDYDADQMMVRVSTLPTDAAYAGEDFVICGIDTAIVNATAPSIGKGLWTTASTATIVTPSNIRTELLNLSIGTNEFIWTLSNGACINYSTDTILITMDSAPIANADSFVVIFNSNGTTIDVTTNDALNNNWNITISESMNSGTLTNFGTGEFEVLLQEVLINQSFIYELCNPSCPAIYCDTALVILDVQGGTLCNFPNMITPNNDGTNETFIVPCLDGVEGTKFSVYNRWGDSLYENDNYKNDWGGTHHGAPVPDATYFYIMELADGQRFQGFVEVRR